MACRDVIALDGPSGTGKSTVARALALRMGLRYLDTGAMYRAVAWAVLGAGIDPDDDRAVVELARSLRVEISTDPRQERVVVDGQQVAREIRSPEVTVAVSPVSATAEVRRVLVAAQQSLIGPGGIVVEGRDIGTVVAPDAAVKVFLTASRAVRAHRRASQDGEDADLVATADALHRRDTYDTSRPVSPLQRAVDAVEFDTTALPVDEVVSRLVDLARSRGVVGCADVIPVGPAEQP